MTSPPEGWGFKVVFILNSQMGSGVKNEIGCIGCIGFPPNF